jgi:pyruvate/2-oxoglutarate/acetoin dehydrogenase E1 component
MSFQIRKLKYCLAINEALHQMMENDESVFIIGQGVKSPWYVGRTAEGLLNRFGSKRVIDTPVSENAVTGSAVGASIVGMRPIVVHPRMDFMLYAMDPIINEAANWFYMNGGKQNVPVVIWGIINRGGEQAAQHSQALQTIFAHIPGLKVVMPATSYDAKGLMVAAIKDNNPVVFIDDRWLHYDEGEVPEPPYSVPIGKANIVQEGHDLTIIGASFMMKLARQAVQKLNEIGSQVELIDLRTIKPIDTETIINSVMKTRRAIIADPGWRTYGMAAEIAAIIQEHAFNVLKAPIARICLPDAPAPANRNLEKLYYPTVDTIFEQAKKILKLKRFETWHLSPQFPNFQSSKVTQVVP